MNNYNQRGVSLISLMIGLVVSMIAVLGVTTLFRTVLKNNTEASVSAQITAERASAFLITDMHLHDAGYGTDGTEDTNLAFFASSSPSGSRITPAEGEGKSLIWRFKKSPEPDSTNDYLCAGLSLEGSAIYLLTSKTVPCNSVTAAANGNWEKQKLFQTPPLDDAGILLNFEVTRTLCSGFGVAGEGSLKVTLQTEHNLGPDLDPIQLDSTTCLLNFP